MAPPDPPPPEAVYPYTEASSIQSQLLSLMQAQQQQQQQQQQARERELQTERHKGILEVVTTFQALVLAQGAAGGPINVRAALQELTRMVTASSSSSSSATATGQQALNFVPKFQLHPPANNNNNSIAGGGSSGTITLLDQLLLRQQQQQQQTTCASSFQQTNPASASLLSMEAMANFPAAAVRAGNTNIMDNDNTWTTNNSNKNQKLKNDTNELVELTAPLSVQQEEQVEATITTQESKKNNNNKKTPQRHENFPEKLYRILIELEAKGKDDIISFSAEGDTFEIYRPEVFEDEIIPLYFQHKKLGSFIRQLGLYCFKRVSKGRIEMEYHHEFFRKNQPNLLSLIKRTSKNKGKAVAAVACQKSMIHDEEEELEVSEKDDEAQKPAYFPAAKITSSSESAGQGEEERAAV